MFSACPVCYLPVEEAISLMPDAPSFSPVIQNLTYIIEENSTRSEFGGSEFGGYPSLKQRIDSYDIRESMSIHCGYGLAFTDSSFEVDLVAYLFTFKLFTTYIAKCLLLSFSNFLLAHCVGLYMNQ